MKELTLIKELREALDKFEKSIVGKNNENDYELYLRITAGAGLSICFNIGDGIYDIGYITKEGKCYILSSDGSRNNYKLWLEKGGKIKKDHCILWNGREYSIGGYRKRYRHTYDYGFLHSKDENNEHCKIFDFTSARPCFSELDDILRYPNGTAILF